MGEPPVILLGPLPPPYHGQSMAFAALVEGLAERGVPFQVHDLFPEKRPDAQVAGAGWRRARQLMGVTARFLGWVLRTPRTTVYITIAQSRLGFLRDAVMIWAARAGGHRIVVHLHGGNYDGFYAAQPGWLQWVVRATLRQCSSVLVLGDRLRAMFDFEPALRDRVQVVPNGLPIARPVPMPAKRLPPLGAPVQLLFLSNLVESKGYFDVLEAVDHLVNRYGLAVECHFAGRFLCNPTDDVRVTSEAQARALFEVEVRQRGLESRISVHGVVAGREKDSLLDRCHFFLLPTNYDNEGQPIALIEAMSVGAVVISTAYRAIPELVEDGVTGHLVPYRRPDLIAQRVRALMVCSAEFERMSAAALTRFTEQFTREAHLRKLIPQLLANGISVAPVMEGTTAYG